jgi:hypothetical protein
VDLAITRRLPDALEYQVERIFLIVDEQSAHSDASHTPRDLFWVMMIVSFVLTSAGEAKDSMRNNRFKAAGVLA